MIHKKPSLCLAAILVAVLSLPAPVHAEWVWSPELGKFVSPKDDTRDNSTQQFDYALDLYKQKQYDKAADELSDLLKVSPGAKIAPEAQYRLGTIYEEKGDFYKALKAYQKMIEIYPQNDRFEEVIEREFKLGQLFLSGKRGRFFGVEIRPALPIAVQAFEHITKYAPYGAFGDKAQFNMAIAQKRAGQFDAALESLQDVIDHYPQSPLVEQARYELAETAYFRSIAQARDERALDKASEEVKGFIDRFPGAPGTEKAAKIREEIDEKNAEKNFKIGEYYEKDNYVQSSLIYYRDVARRYPHTQWGVKAEERLRALNQPVQYIASERDRIEADYEDTKKRLSATTDSSEKEVLQRKLERLDKHRKTVEKEKGDSVQRLAQDLARREAELKEKFKNLDLKIKKHKDNQSEDFKKAIERWRASLEAERDAIESEKQQLAGWKSELGMGKPFYEGWMPFTGEPKSPLQKVQSIDAKDLYKISEKKKKALDEKETLYKQYQQVSELATGKPASVEAKQDDSKSIPAALRDKLEQYGRRFGPDEWLNGVRRVLGLGKAETINPFKDTALGSKNPQELLELRQHLKEKVDSSQNVVDTLSTAFNEELAAQEQEKLAEKLEGQTAADPKALRKEIKKTEKDIRFRYEDIEERDKRKKKELDDLDRLIGNKAEKTAAQKISSAAFFPVRATRVFLFGRDDSASSLTKKAGKSNDAVAQDLKKEIETESLMIQAQIREIEQLEKKLEILRAQTSLENGVQFRSAMVTVPYVFIDDAVNNAEKLVTPEQRQNMLIEKLSQKTKELEALKRELEQVDAAVAKLPADTAQADAMQTSSNPISDKEGMRTDIEKAVEPLKPSLPTAGASSVTAESMPNVDKKVLKELREIEQSLSDVITDQIDLENAEKKILEKRMTAADDELQKLSSKAARADLLSERERMDAQISELTQRLDFLGKEKTRFTK